MTLKRQHGVSTKTKRADMLLKRTQVFSLSNFKRFFNYGNLLAIQSKYKRFGKCFCRMKIILFSIQITVRMRAQLRIYTKSDYIQIISKLHHPQATTIRNNFQASRTANRFLIALALQRQLIYYMTIKIAKARALKTITITQFSQSIIENLSKLPLVPV